jgi:hypothetical protein
MVRPAWLGVAMIAVAACKSHDAHAPAASVPKGAPVAAATSPAPPALGHPCTAEPDVDALDLVDHGDGGHRGSARLFGRISLPAALPRPVLAVVASSGLAAPSLSSAAVAHVAADKTALDYAFVDFGSRSVERATIFAAVDLDGDHRIGDGDWYGWLGAAPGAPFTPAADIALADSPRCGLDFALAVLHCADAPTVAPCQDPIRIADPQ